MLQLLTGIRSFALAKKVIIDGFLRVCRQPSLLTCNYSEHYYTKSSAIRQVRAKTRLAFGSPSGQLIAVHRSFIDALDAHDQAFIDIGAGGDRIVGQPIVIRQFALLGRQQRQD